MTHRPSGEICGSSAYCSPKTSMSCSGFLGSAAGAPTLSSSARKTATTRQELGVFILVSLCVFVPLREVQYRLTQRRKDAKGGHEPSGFTRDAVGAPHRRQPVRRQLAEQALLHLDLRGTEDAVRRQPV